MKSSDVRKSINLFTLKLYQAVKVHKKENIFFGPASVYAVIAMLYSGAKDSTAEELRKVLCLPDDSGNFADIFSTLWIGVLKSNKSGKDFIFDVANRLWVNEGLKIEDKYLKVLKKNFKSDAVNLDFFKNIDAAAEKINKWVAENTMNKITDIVQPETLSINTNFVITNTMYFYGKWVDAFDPGDTEKMAFQAPSGEINVDMMYQKSSFGFEESDEYDCKVLLLPYKKCSLTLLLILPNEDDGILELEEKLFSESFSSFDISKWLTATSTEVNVYLPKFQISETSDLEIPLKNIGLERLFVEADLSGISKTGKLFVSSISHAAYIDVNESGTEIAASTQCSIRRACIRRIPEFRANHPFLMMVIDKDTEMILFLGRLCKPSST